MVEIKCEFLLRKPSELLIDIYNNSPTYIGELVRISKSPTSSFSHQRILIYRMIEDGILTADKEKSGTKRIIRITDKGKDLAEILIFIKKKLDSA